MFVPGIYSQTLYPVVTSDNSSIPIGSIVYLQSGTFGTPIGLLLSLTLTPLFKKCLKTNGGLIGIV